MSKTDRNPIGTEQDRLDQHLYLEKFPVEEGTVKAWVSPAGGRSTTLHAKRKCRCLKKSKNPMKKELVVYPRSQVSYCNACCGVQE